MIMMNVVESIGYTRNFMAIFQNLRKKKRSQIEKIHRNMDSAISWIEYLADGQDCKTRRKAPDAHLQGR